MKKNRKGQEEIVGFVLIVVVFLIIGLIFLGIMLRNDNPKAKDSVEVMQFLESTSQFTTECALVYEPEYSSVKELIGQCYNEKRCISGESACEALNKTMGGLLDSSWKVSIDSPIKAYSFEIKYENNVTEESVLKIQRGDCNGEKVGAEQVVFPYSTSLTICS